MTQTKSQLLNPISGHINVSGIITASQFIGTSISISGISTITNLQSSNLSASGIGTITTLNATTLRNYGETVNNIGNTGTAATAWDDLSTAYDQFKSGEYKKALNTSGSGAILNMGFVRNPSPQRKPAASCKSAPGVRMVIPSCSSSLPRFMRISSGSSTTTLSDVVVSESLL